MAEAALLTERSALQHYPGHVGGDVLCAPDFGECLEGAVIAPLAPGEGDLLHKKGGPLHHSLGCELPEKAPVPLFCAARGNHVFASCGEPRQLCQLLTAGLFQVLAFGDVEDELFAPMYLFLRFLRHPSLSVLSLVLTGLATLLQRGKMVSRAQSRGAMLAARGWGGG